MRIVLLREKHILTKKNAQAERLYFFICILHKTLSLVIVVIEKHQNNYFIQVKPHFLVVEFSKNVTLEEMLVLKSY